MLLIPGAAPAILIGRFVMQFRLFLQELRNMSFLVAYVLFPVVSYLIGSISFGLLVAKIKSVDLRSQGSGNVGATNVLRVLGTKAGGVVFGLDVLKGAVPALALAYIGRAVAPDAPSLKMLGIIYGACAIFGHVYPIFHQLRGGKAVATSCGVFLCLAPLQTLTALAVWAVVLIFWKYVSVASMAAALSFFLMVLALYHQAADLPAAVPEKEFMVITALRSPLSFSIGTAPISRGCAQAPNPRS